MNNLLHIHWLIVAHYNSLSSLFMCTQKSKYLFMNLWVIELDDVMHITLHSGCWNLRGREANAVTVFFFRACRFVSILAISILQTSLILDMWSGYMVMCFVWSLFKSMPFSSLFLHKTAVFFYLAVQTGSFITMVSGHRRTHDLCALLCNGMNEISWSQFTTLS